MPAAPHSLLHFQQNACPIGGVPGTGPAPLIVHSRGPAQTPMDPPTVERLHQVAGQRNLGQARVRWRASVFPCGTVARQPQAALPCTPVEALDSGWMHGRLGRPGECTVRGAGPVPWTPPIRHLAWGLTRLYATVSALNSKQDLLSRPEHQQLRKTFTSGRADMIRAGAHGIAKQTSRHTAARKRGAKDSP